MPATASEHDLLTRLDSQVHDVRKLLRAIAGLAAAITAAAFYTAFEAGKGTEALRAVRAEVVDLKGELKGELKGLRAELTGRIDRIDRDLAGLKADMTTVKAEMTTVRAGLDRIEKALTAR